MDQKYNGAGPTFPDPQTLTCDTGTSQFTYTDGGGVQQQIASIQCTCNPNPCGAPPTGPGVSTTAPAVDANCVYTSDVVCTPPLMMGIQVFNYS
uniref:Uncharacterized protein n=1 Tax=Panagrolaimus davidi TaxID=227884 RepID=A0A914PP15_9BILA